MANKIEIIITAKNLALKTLNLAKNGLIGVLNLVKKLAKVGFIALSVAVGKATFDAVKFEKTMRNIKTLLDDKSFKDVGKTLNKGFKDLEKGALKTIKEFGFSIEDTNKALFDTISAGIPASEAIEFLNEAAKLAVGGVTDLSTAVDGATTIYNVYKGEIESVSSITNAFFTAQKFGKTTVEELAKTIGKVAPIAKVAGIRFEELLAATSQLTLAGLDTDLATTALRQSISALVNPAKEARKLFEELGIPFGKAALSGGNLAKTLGILAEKSEGNVDQLAQLIPNIRALTGIAALGEKELASYDKILSSIVKDTNSLNNAFEEQQKTFAQQFKIFRGTIRVIGIELANKFLPTLTNAITKLNNILSEIDVAIALEKLILNIRIELIKLRTIIAIITEQIKEIIVSPFIFETYKPALTKFFTAYKDFIKENGAGIAKFASNPLLFAVQKTIPGVAETLKKGRDGIRKQEMKDTESFEQELLQIKEKGQNEIIELQNEFNDKIEQLNNEALENEKENALKEIDITKNKLKQQEVLENIFKDARKSDFKDFAENIVNNTKNRIEKEKEIEQELREGIKEIELKHIKDKEDINKDYLQKINNLTFDSEIEKSEEIKRLREEENQELEELEKDRTDAINEINQDAAEKRKEIEGGIIKDIGEAIKTQLKNQVTAMAATEIAKASAIAIAAAIPTFGASLLGLGAQIAGITAAAGIAYAAIDAVKFHDGGIVGKGTKSRIKNNEVNAILEEGERVITQPQNDAILGALSVLNSKLDNLGGNNEASIEGNDLTIPIFLDGEKIAESTVSNYNKARLVNTIPQFIGE